MRQIHAARVSGTLLVVLWLLGDTAVSAQIVTGTVRDQTGMGLPGATVELRGAKGAVAAAVTNGSGAYRIEPVAPGLYHLSVSLVNFATWTRSAIHVSPEQPARVDVTLQLALSADITVTGTHTFTNLAEVERPHESLLGIAQAASQGAITAQQLEGRPILRAGEVLETVPGVVITQHSGQGKANQYYLRGFNLDHGTDFAVTVAGMPVNLPTHGHGHGYSDLNFLIPELVSGVQFSKGPYFAEHGDFATAGAATISYVNVLGAPIVHAETGGGYGRVFAAASPDLTGGHLLGALEIERNHGPWERREGYRKLNGVIRFSRGDTTNGLSATAMGYHAQWNATDQIPRRAVAQGRFGRFGTIDPSDGGHTSRYSGSLEWQRSVGSKTTKLTAYGTASDLNLFSNFTFFLHDPENGDQFEQVDRRMVTGAKLVYRRIDRWSERPVHHTLGVHVRNDDIATVGLYHTRERQRLTTVRQDSILQTSGAVFLQNELQWTSRLRSVAALRVDGYRFSVSGSDAVNSGRRYAGLLSPKGGVVVGPFKRTELYLNAGYGFHSNDARAATLRRDPLTGAPAGPVRPLVQARGGELGVRSVVVPRLQSTVAVWTLSLDSELVFVGDAGTTEAVRPSRRYGVEWTNYFVPTTWLRLDADLSFSRARFSGVGRSGERIPGAVGAVASAGLTLKGASRLSGSVRLRSVGRRPLIEDNSVRSGASTLVNADLEYRVSRYLRLNIDLFNLFNAIESDVEYYYASRLSGEPLEGVEDVHFHPTLPRTARVRLVLRF